MAGNAASWKLLQRGFAQHKATEAVEAAVHHSSSRKADRHEGRPERFARVSPLRAHGPLTMRYFFAFSLSVQPPVLPTVCILFCFDVTRCPAARFGKRISQPYRRVDVQLLIFPSGFYSDEHATGHGWSCFDRANFSMMMTSKPPSVMSWRLDTRLDATYHRSIITARAQVRSIMSVRHGSFFIKSDMLMFSQWRS